MILEFTGFGGARSSFALKYGSSLFVCSGGGASGCYVTKKAAEGSIVHAVIFRTPLGFKLLKVSSAFECCKNENSRKRICTFNIGTQKCEIKVRRKWVSFLAITVLIATLPAIGFAGSYLLRSYEDARVAEIKFIESRSILSSLESAVEMLSNGDLAGARMKALSVLEKSPVDERALKIFCDSSNDRSQSNGDDEIFARANMLYGDAKKFVLSGDIELAMLRLHDAGKILTDAAVDPHFSDEISSLSEKLSGKYASSLEAELKLAKVARTEVLTNKRAELFSRAVKKLMSAEIVEPENPEIALAKGELLTSLGTWADRQMSSAAAAEKLFGCDRALPVYDVVSKATEGLSLPCYIFANDKLEACKKRKSAMNVSRTQD